MEDILLLFVDPDLLFSLFEILPPCENENAYLTITTCQELR